MSKSKIASVAFQGEPGAFSHIAAQKFLGSNIKTVPYSTFRLTFEAVKTGATQYAVIPIENTLHGSVHENYDNLLAYDVPICGETSVRISHHLIAMPGARFRDIRQAYSHPVALNQCRRFFEKNKAIQPISYYDTAGSVKMLQAERPTRAAAIASEAAAGAYGGVILRRNIEDDRRNFTRFFLLTKQRKKKADSSSGWKTSLVFSTANAPGALFKAMACFALRNLNLTKIESSPLKGRPWEYLFYVDLAGYVDDEAVQHALSNLKEMTRLLKVLGSYQTVP